MPKLTINGRKVEVAEGTSVLQACEQLGLEIPRFCYHKKLKIAGSCRMCLVEIEKMPKLAASCAQPCAEGMVVHTNSPKVQAARKGVMEMLLINHPLDCPVCDQGGECDLQELAVLYGRDRSRTTEAKRVVKDKDLGPLIATTMTRCIHCTRCIRFLNEVAGTPELGALFRGENMEIAGLAPPLRSELSGNLIDICPVGALNSKPYAAAARPWELKKTASIDVMDAVGSNIRVDSRDGEVMRIAPRANDAINEEWISDKARFACDGLKYQRLEQPYVRKEGYLRPASWDEALDVVAKHLKKAAPERIAALAGDQADGESLFALKRLMDTLGAPHYDCRQDAAVYHISARAGYIMNTGIAAIEQADALLLIGTNPRHEATLINARIYKRWRRGGLTVGLIGEDTDLGYPYRSIGASPSALRDIVEGKYPFAKTLRNAQRPMLILGAGALARPDGAAIHTMAREIAEKCNMIRLDWNGFNVLQLAASRVGGLDLGFVPVRHGFSTAGILRAAERGEMDVIYLLGADEIDTAKLGNTFVVYQGHHGDRGAHRADVVVPGAAYTEKTALYVNTEGRPQMTQKAVAPPGEAREDWTIIHALATATGHNIGFSSLPELQEAMFVACPHLAATGEAARAEWKTFGKAGILAAQPFMPTIENFYMTDPISRASPTMAQCTAEIGPLLVKKVGRHD